MASIDVTSDGLDPSIGEYFTKTYQEGVRYEVPGAEIIELKDSKQPWIEWMIKEGKRIDLNLEPTGRDGAPIDAGDEDLRIGIRPKHDYLFKVYLQYELERMMNGYRSVRILSYENRTNEEREFQEKFEELSELFRKTLEDFFLVGVDLSGLGERFEFSISEEAMISHSQGARDRVNLNIRIVRAIVEHGDSSRGFYQSVSERMVKLLFQESRKKIDSDNELQISLLEQRFYNGLAEYIESLLVRSIADADSAKLEEELLRLESRKMSADDIGRLLDSINRGVEDIEGTIRYASRNLSLAMLSVLDAEGLVNRRPGYWGDMFLHYDGEKFEKMNRKKDGGSPPNMLEFSRELKDTIGHCDVERFRSRDLHPIFRTLERYPVRWMNCCPEDHNRGRHYHEVWKEDIPHEGGYLIPRPVSGLRFTVAGERRFEKRGFESRTDIKNDEVVHALNILQKTQWEINLDLLNEISTGRGTNNQEIDDFKKKDVKIESIEIDEDFLIAWNYSDGGPEGSEEDEEQQRRLNYIKKIIDNIGNVFWHSWSLDWRGRVFAKAPLLSPQQSDFDRALIRFKDWKPLGENGWKWFKIFLFGFLSEKGGPFDSPPPDKRVVDSEKEKSDWVENNIEYLLKIRKNWGEYKSYLDLDKRPKAKSVTFQRLAVLIELGRIWDEYEKVRNWDKVKSGHPVHFDASASGYQHLSVLIEDTDLAEKVNVIETGKNRKMDIYQEVADSCKRKWGESELREFLLDMGVSSQDIKNIRDAIFDRSIAKQPTMTMIYGAQRLGKCFKGRKGRGKPKFIKIGKLWYDVWHDDSPIRNAFKSRSSISGMLERDGSLFEENLDDKTGRTRQAVFSDKLEEAYKEAVNEVTEGTFEELEEKLKQSIKEKYPEKGVKREVRYDWTLPDGFTVKYQYRQKEKRKNENQEFMKRSPILGKLFKDLEEGARNLIRLIEIIDESNESEIKIDDDFVNEAISEFKSNLRERVMEKMYKRYEPDTSKKEKRQAWKKSFYRKYGCEGLESIIKGYGEDLPTRTKSDKRYKTDLVNLICKLDKQSDRHNFWETLKHKESRAKSGSEDLTRAIRDHIKTSIKKRDPTPFEKKWLLSSNVFISAPFKEINEKLDYQRMRRAIAPNFIHSLDGAHMRAFVREFDRRVSEESHASIWSVHDSFGTHACDIETMREVVLTEFMRLHNGRTLQSWISDKKVNNDQVDRIMIGSSKYEMSNFFIN